MAIAQNTVIILKYSDTTAVPPSLNVAEPAYSNVSNKLWIGDKDGAVVAIGGKYYTEDLETATWQGTGNKLVRRDASGQIEASKYLQQGFDVLQHANEAFTLANTVSGEGLSSVFAQANAAYDTANSSYVQANAAFVKANTAAGSNGAIQFNLLGGYGAHNEFYYNSGQKTVYANTFYASLNVDAQNVIAYNRFYAGVATSQATPVPYLLAQFTGNSAPYSQVNLQNIDGTGSADFVVTSDVGDDSTFFITTGMQGSQLEQGALFPLDGYVIVQGNTSQFGGNLVIGAISGTPGVKTKIVSHGYETSNVVAEFDETSVIFHPEVISPTTTRISLHANSAYESQNTTGVYSNTAYLHANAAYVSQNTTGVYSNTAYLHANAAYESQNTTGQYANSAFIKANSAYTSQNSTGQYANSSYLHANAAYVSQNTTGVYANAAYAFANASFNDSNTRVLRSGDAMTGDLSTTGNMYSQVVYANTQFYAGIATQSATLLPNTVAQFTSNSNNYTQVNNQNIDPDGSADYVVTSDVGSDTQFYIDMGILNSQYNNQNPNNSLGTSASPLDGYLYVQGNTGQVGGNLIIGTTSPNQLVKIIAGGVDSEHVIVQVDGAGVNVNGNLFVSQGFTSTLTNAIYSHANSAYVSQNTTGQYANSAYLHANAAYESQNTTGVYVNTAYAFANTSNAYFYGVSNTVNVAITSTGNYANSAYLHANSAYVSQNSTGQYANSSYLHANAAYTSQNSSGQYANSAYLHANASYVSQNTTGVYANTAYLHANAAYVSQNTTGQYANSAYLHANSAYVSQNTTGVYANAAYDLANTKFATAGGTITGDVVINANLTVSGTTTYVNTQTVLVGDNILTLNADIPAGQQPTENAGIEVDRGLQPNASLIWIESAGKWSANNGNTSYYLGTDASESYANSAYLHANSAYVSQNTTGQYANSAYLHANSAYVSQNTTGVYANTGYLHANSAYVSQNSTGQYANSAYLHANSSYEFANTSNAYFYGVSNTVNVAITSTGNYANSSYLHANSAYVSQNTTGVYANAAYSFANTANAYFYGVSNTINVAVTSTGNYANSGYIHANAAYTSQNTTGSYANSSYLHANSAYVSQNSTGQYANSSYLHANAAYVSQNTTGQYANSAYLHANAAYVKANTAAGSDGQLQLNYSGGFGASANLNFSNTTNTLTTNNVTAIANVGYANTTGVLKVYQFYNAGTNSLDTVFV